MNKLVYTTDKDAVRCIDAQHLNETITYTWSVAPNVEINEGDLLLVATTVRDGISLAVACSSIYYLTKEDHEKNIHPYCSVLKNFRHRIQ